MADEATLEFAKKLYECETKSRRTIQALAASVLLVPDFDQVFALRLYLPFRTLE